LLTGSRGALSREKLDTHVSAIAAARQAGHEVLVVSSGAIAAGFPELGYTEKPKVLEQKQAAAAVGQGILMHAYRESFLRFNMPVAQILLSRKDFSVRESYNNALNTISLLLERGVVPIINENDTVATREITFGDNDVLSALVGTLVHADLVVILTDIDGLYTGNPRTNPAASKVEWVPAVTDEILSLADTHGSAVGTGGMLAKVRAAEVALSLGSRLYVGTGVGQPSDHILDILSERGGGTYFGEQVTPMQRKKQWIAYHAAILGKVVVDDGAVQALLSGKHSLLPVGVRDVFGDFKSDDTIEILDPNGRIIGKGVSSLAASELLQVAGQSTAEACVRLQRDKIQVVHKDNLVLLYSEQDVQVAGE
jgi:glutamate 5-kinase